MRYELMLPHQIRTAIEERWPVVLPLGPLEYHGEHLSVGMDTLAVTRAIDRIEAEMDLVVLPPFYYGASSYAVEGPEDGRGSVQVEAEHLIPVARDLFRSLLRIGFRDIHVVIHHQTEQFDQGMPTDLAFRTAARTVLFEWLEAERGEGWWGRSENATYYSDRLDAADPFSWILVHPLMDAAIIDAYVFDHAGKGETSLMMALAPETVDLDRLDHSAWYTASASEASLDFGQRGTDLILERLREILRR